MMKSFTPKESRDYPKNKEIKKAPAVTRYSPSPLAIQFVFGYAAALNVLKTKSLGNLSILVN